MIESLDHVVVVGAGISGLAAGLLLQPVVTKITLVERAPEPAKVGAGIALQANGMAVLSRLGLLAGLEKRAVRIERLETRSSDGRALLASELPDLSEGLDHALAVRRTDLHRALLDAVGVHGQIETRFGWNLESAGPDGNLDLVSAGGDRDRLRANVVVGADGVSSRVRAAPGFRSRTTPGARYARAIVAGRADPALVEYWTPLGSFGRAPVAPDEVYFWVGIPEGPCATAVDHGDLDALASRWAAVVPDAGELLSRVSGIDELLINTVRRVDCPRWWNGRLVLIGDAAHAMAPNLGQGANSSLVDAAVLADTLRRSASVDAALAAYDHRRRPVVRRIQQLAGALQLLSGLQPAWQRGVRDQVLRVVSHPSLARAAARRALWPDVQAVR